MAVVLVVLGALFMPTSADAQLLLMREHERLMDSGRLGMGVDLQSFFGYRKGSGYSFVQPTVMASYRFREVVFEGAVPFGYFHENNDPGEDHDKVALGNPWGALLYLPDCECGLSRLSLGIAAPVANSGARTDRVMQGLARGVGGDWDGYLWLPDMLPLVLGASTRKEIRWLRLSWDADLIFGLPGGGRAFDFGAQTAGEADILIGWQTTFGARISGVFYPTLPGDAFQSAITTYVRYMRPSDSFALRFVLNLDPPAGFAFSRDGMWGLGLLYARSFL